MREYKKRLVVRLSVFPHDILKTSEARIIKLIMRIFHHESWKSIYFTMKGQRSRSRNTKNIAGMVRGGLVSVSFFGLMMLTVKLVVTWFISVGQIITMTFVFRCLNIQCIVSY